MNTPSLTAAEVGHDLVARYADLIYGACLRVLGNHHDAEDAAQDALLKVMRADRSAVNNEPAWIHTVAVRTAQDLIRSNSRRRARDHIAPPPTEPANPASVSEAIDEREAILAALDGALLELTPADADLIRQRYLLERSQTDLASDLAISQPAVAKRLNRALERLRRAMTRGGAAFALLTVIGSLEAAGGLTAPADCRQRLAGLALGQQLGQAGGQAIAGGSGSVSGNAGLGNGLSSSIGTGMATGMSSGASVALAAVVCLAILVTVSAAWYLWPNADADQAANQAIGTPASSATGTTTADATAAASLSHATASGTTTQRSASRLTQAEPGTIVPNGAAQPTFTGGSDTNRTDGIITGDIRRAANGMLVETDFVIETSFHDIPSIWQPWRVGRPHRHGIDLIEPLDDSLAGPNGLILPGGVGLWVPQLLNHNSYRLEIVASVSSGRYFNIFGLPVSPATRWEHIYENHEVSHQLPTSQFVIVVECHRLGPDRWDISYSLNQVPMHRGIYQLTNPNDLLLYSLDMEATVHLLTIWSCTLRDHADGADRQPHDQRRHTPSSPATDDTF